MQTLVALLKREVLEHRNLWRVPMILIGIAVLVKLSLSIGNLSLDYDLPEQLELDSTIDSVLDGVIAKALGVMNAIIMLVMFVLAVSYALACLFNERQDESVLFWRSLPVSDGMTVASKLIIALAVIPLIVVACQALVAILFFGTDSIQYLSNYYSQSLLGMGKILLWSLLPIIAWCVLCSEVASKTPFIMAFFAPLAFVVIDKLFLNGVISQTFIINRVTGIDHYTLMPLVWGLLFSAGCIFLAIIKRSQRI